MYKIPNVFHFCYFGGRPFDFVNYLTIKSAFDVNKPEEMFIYVDQEPEGQWWEKAKQYVTIIKIKLPKEVFGMPLMTPPHQANVVRLEKLIEHGGIYLDLDVVCRKPFTPLLSYHFVLGKEDIYGAFVGLCNAVILSEKNAMFAQRWLEGFDPKKSYWKGLRSNGHDKYFTELGVKYPKFLATIYPEEIHVEPRESFFRPNYSEEEIKEFFETNNANYDTSYCHHLWAKAYYEKYLKDAHPELLKNDTTAFSELAKKFLD